MRHLSILVENIVCYGNDKLSLLSIPIKTLHTQ